MLTVSHKLFFLILMSKENSLIFLSKGRNSKDTGICTKCSTNEIYKQLDGVNVDCKKVRITCLKTKYTFVLLLIV